MEEKHTFTHTHTPTTVHTGEFGEVGVPRRLTSGRVFVCARMTSLHIGTGPDRISLGPVLSVFEGKGEGGGGGRPLRAPSELSNDEERQLTNKRVQTTKQQKTAP